MNRSTLNLVATILFAVAAILFFLGGTEILGALFAVLAVISGIQVVVERSRARP
jgi:hypothetical protein